MPAISPGGSGAGSADINRISLQKADDSLYVVIRLSQASYSKTQFVRDKEVYVDVDGSSFTIQTEKINGARPFCFREESNGILKLSINYSLIKPYKSLDLVEGEGPVEIGEVSCRKGYFKGKWPS